MILLAILVLFLVLNLKVLPGAWHIRVLHGIYAQTHAPRPKNDKKKPVFKYLVTSTRATPFECDYNGHKSNSTYFSDLDINRTQLLARLFKPVLSASHYDRSKRKRHLNIALGSTCCVFRREIRPLQEVEIWSRVVSWDEKWVYLASYFVRGQSSSCSKEKVLSHKKRIPWPLASRAMSSRMEEGRCSRWKRWRTAGCCHHTMSPIGRSMKLSESRACRWEDCWPGWRDFLLFSVRTTLVRYS